MKTVLIILVTLVCALLPQDSQAQIPRTLSYQGVLSDSLGTPKPDGEYSLTFRLFETSAGGSPIWTEQKNLQLRRGLFQTVLGDVMPFGPAVGFDRPYWLSIQVGTEPELSPRIPMTSVGYSFNSIKADTARYALTAPQQSFVDSARIAGTIPDNTVTSAKIVNGTIQRVDVATAFISPYADTAAYARTAPQSGFVDSARAAYNADMVDGLHASSFLSTASDYGRQGVATNLYEGTSSLTSKYVNAAGPDTVNATSGTAFTARLVGSSSSVVRGIQGYVDNASGPAAAGVFSTSYAGSGSHTGVQGTAGGSSSSSVVGVYGMADNTSTGNSYGGKFLTSPFGTGVHYGVEASASGSSVDRIVGVAGNASNSSSPVGPAYGGFFTTSSSGAGVAAISPSVGGYFTTFTGPGQRTGVNAVTEVSSGAADGIIAVASCTGNGFTWGGVFDASSAGGERGGVWAFATGYDSEPAYGVLGGARNNSSGAA
ncbi:MAG: hypothetical protein AAB393_10970, partial [Bacteroidota bacterium]